MNLKLNKKIINLILQIMRLKKLLTFVVTVLFGVSSAFAQSDDLYEIAQTQGTDDFFLPADVIEGSEYNTYIAHGVLEVAIFIENIDVANCDYVVLKFAEPIPQGWSVGFWDQYDMEPITPGATEYKYVFSEDPSCAVTNNILPKIMLLTDFDGDFSNDELSVKLTGVYKHKTKSAMQTGIPYYIRNAANGLFLAGDNNWGTQLATTNAGDVFVLENTASGYNIVNKSLASNVANKFLGDDGEAYFVDKPSPAMGGFTIEPVSATSKYYTIRSNYKDMYLVYNPNSENGIGGFPKVENSATATNANAMWEFITKDELIQEMTEIAGTKIVKDNVMKVTTTKNWVNQSWNAQIEFNLPTALTVGKQYTFQFVMKGKGEYNPYESGATEDNHTTIYDKVNIDPWLSVIGVDNSTAYNPHLVAGNEWTTVEFVSDGVRAYDRLNLNYGGAKGEIYVSSMKIIDNATGSVIYSTDFDELGGFKQNSNTDNMTTAIVQEENTVSTVFDASSLVQNPHFNRNHDNSNWKFVNLQQNGPYNGQNGGGNYLVEAYKHDIEVSQVVEVPNGYYTVSVNALYANSTDDVPVLYANDKTVSIPLRDDATINNMQTACDAFLAGRYMVTTPVVLVTDGKLEIGVKGGNVDSWTILDNFTVSYMGSATDLSALRTALNSALLNATTLRNKNAKMGKTAADNLKDVIANYGGKQFDNPNEYNDAIQTVNQTIAAANASIAGYELITPYVDKVDELDDAGQNAFYANNSAKSIMVAYRTGTLDETKFSSYVADLESAYIEGVKKQMPVSSMIAAAPATWVNQTGTYGGISNGRERYSQSIFDINTNVYQTISGLQNGTYEIDLEGSASWTEGNGVSGGTAGPNRAELYANDQTYSINVENRTWVSEGETDRTTFTVKVTDGVLTYGLRNKLTGANWFVVRLNSIKFVKGGSIDDLRDDLKELKATANEIIAENPAMNAQTMKNLKNAAAKNPAEESLTAYNDCISELTKAISDANSSSAVYKTLGELLEKAEVFDENGKDAFYNDANIVPIYNVYKNGTYDEVTDYSETIAYALADAAKKQTAEGSDMTLAALGNGCLSPFEADKWYLSRYDVDNDVYLDEQIKPTLSSGQHGFQLNTWSTENSTLKVPFMEYWTSRWDATQATIHNLNLAPGKIRHNTIEGLPQGLYRVRIWARYTNEDPNNNNWFVDNYGNIEYPQGAKFVANGEEADLAKNGNPGLMNTTPIVQGTYTVETFVGREGTLDLGFDIPADGLGNWIAFKSLQITYVSYTDAATILTSKGTGDASAAGTFYAPFDAKMPSGVKAYTVDYMYQKDGENATYTSTTPISLDGKSYYYTHETLVADGDSPYATERARQNAADEVTDKNEKAEILATPLNTIPAGTPVILRTVEPVSRMYVYGTPQQKAESATKGIIKGVTVGGDVPADAWTLQKFIAPNKVDGRNVTTVGFKKLTAKTTIDDNRCYVVFLDGEANIDIVDSVGKGTFVAPIAIEIPEDVQAYTIENLDKGALIQEPVNRLIPAKTAVVVNMKDKNSKTVNFKFKFVKEKTNKFLYVTGVLSGVLDDESYAVPARSYVLQRLVHTKVLKRQSDGSYKGEYVPTSVLAKWYVSANRDNTYELTHKSAENIKAYVKANQEWEAARKAGTNTTEFFTQFPIPYWTDGTSDPVTKFKTAFYRVGEFEEGDTEKYVYVPNNKCFINGSKANLDSSVKALYFFDDEDFGEDATDISSVGEEDFQSVSAIYSVNGQMLNSLQKGVNILKMSDGSTKKILVK